MTEKYRNDHGRLRDKVLAVMSRSPVAAHREQPPVGRLSLDKVQEPDDSASIEPTSPWPALSPGASGDADLDLVSRPSIFPGGKHAPAPRNAPLEEYYGHSPGEIGRIELLSELKTSRLEGVYNLAFLILAFSLTYLVTRNIVDHGFRVRFQNLCWDHLLVDGAFCVRFAAVVCVTLSCVTLGVVSLQIRSFLAPTVVRVLHLLTIMCTMAVSSAAIIDSDVNPLSGSVLATVITIVILKTHSYVATNQLLAEETAERRRGRKSRVLKKESTSSSSVSDASTSSIDVSQDRTERHSSAKAQGASDPHSAALQQRTNKQKTHGPGTDTASMTHSDGSAPSSVAHKRKRSSGNGSKRMTYPNNVTVRNFLYFLLAPTLVYETSYPRTDRIRPYYIAWYGLQSVLCLALQAAIAMQFCAPVLHSASEANEIQVGYYIMKLAIPSFAIWFLMFLGFFHCTLNAIAEVLRFADRGFYLDWWNATTLNSFWRKWNVPVHEWCLRHLYVESVSRHHIRARTATAGTFFFSAIMHEYVVATGFKVHPFSFSLPYMFLGMGMQLPLMALSNKFDGTRRGNLLMWITLFLGQPLITILYVRQYLSSHDYLMCR